MIRQTGAVLLNWTIGLIALVAYLCGGVVWWLLSPFLVAAVFGTAPRHMEFGSDARVDPDGLAALGMLPYAYYGLCVYRVWGDPAVSHRRFLAYLFTTLFVFVGGTIVPCIGVAFLAKSFGAADARGWVAACFFITLIPAIAFVTASPSRPLFAWIRGRTMSTFKLAGKRAKKLRRRYDPVLTWGGLEVPEPLSKGHFLAIGTTRSGKTVTLRLLLQSAMRDVGVSGNTRALVYDPKREFFPILRGLGLDERTLQVLNPLDQRSVAWNIAADVQTPAAADTLAGILIPETTDQNRYFYDAARQLTRAVIDALILQKTHWTLRHVIAIALDDEALSRALGCDPATRAVYQRYAGERRSYADVQSTLDTCLAGYRIVAALWEHATGTVSLREWMRKNSVLLMGLDRSLERTMVPIYRVMFEFASQLLLNETPEPQDRRRTWVVVDEAREAGRIPGLRSLLNQGAVNGVRVVLGFQDFDGFADAYGQHGAYEVTGLCSNKAILRLDSPSSADWASRTIGEAEVRECTFGMSTSAQGNSYSISEQIRERRLALPSELMNLSMPDRGCVHGYFITPSVGTYQAAVAFARRLRPLVGEPFVPRTDPTQQYLKPITEEELTALGFVTKQEPDKPKPGAASTLFDAQSVSPLDDIPRFDPPASRLPP